MSPIHVLAKMIDHSLLHPTLKDEDMRRGCELAVSYDVASVCIKPYAIKMASEILSGSDVLVGTVVGFPHGSVSTQAKEEETIEACRRGAVEIDMVINIGKALQKDWSYVRDEIRSVYKTCHDNGAILKVIFENDFMPSDEYKIRLCQICSEIGVDYAKTSTGFGFVKDANGKYGYLGATINDLKLMRSHLDPWVKLKAAGGIRTLPQLLAVQEIGVDRVGASATSSLLEAAKKHFGVDGGMLLSDDDFRGY